LAAPQEKTAGIIPLDVFEAGDPPDSTTGDTAGDDTDLGSASPVELEETTGAGGKTGDDLSAGAIAPPPAATSLKFKTARVL